MWDTSYKPLTSTYGNPKTGCQFTSLVRGCERRYALEHCETLLISKPSRFQQYGEELILDPQEGLAKEESVIQTQETAAELSRQKAAADLEEAVELLYSQTHVLHKERHTLIQIPKPTSKPSRHGNEWWIFCTAIRPDDDDWDKWRNTLPQEYDHVSEIGQPATFAQALARMVADQIRSQRRRLDTEHDGRCRNGALQIQDPMGLPRPRSLRRQRVRNAVRAHR